MVTKQWKAERTEGTMKPTKRRLYPKHLLFFDTETHIIEDSTGYIEFPLRLGYAIYVNIDRSGKVLKRVTHEFTTIEGFIEILAMYAKRRQKIHVYAHNIGFDIRVLNLPKVFNDRGYKSKPPILNNMVFIWTVKTPSGTMEFLDTSNFGVRSVAALGADMGYDKMDVDFATVSDTDLMSYCIRDVEILEKFMLEYIRFCLFHRLGEIKITLASQALEAYRNRFMYKAPYIHNNEQALILERKAYYGGRVECLQIGAIRGDRTYYLDVNSMYPFVMKNYELPHKFVGYTENVPLRYLKVRLDTFYCIADVLIETDIPAFPYKTGDRLIFPVGTFRTTLHSCELALAHSKGMIKYVYSMAVYNPAKIFDKYVDFFYALKEQYSREGNKTWRTIAKLFLNSLYGKFGQLMPHRIKTGEDDTQEVWRLKHIDLDDGRRFQEIGWFGEVFEEWKDGETVLSCPAIAGAITALARSLLWGYVETAGTKNTYYMDTDCLFVNQMGYDKLQASLDPYTLGALSREASTHKLAIYGAKDYEFGKQVKHKGIPKKHERIKKNLWQFVQFQGFISWLNGGAKTGATGYIATKSRRETYWTLRADKDGKVQPSRLSPERISYSPLIEGLESVQE